MSPSAARPIALPHPSRAPPPTLPTGLGTGGNCGPMRTAAAWVAGRGVLRPAPVASCAQLDQQPRCRLPCAAGSAVRAVAGPAVGPSPHRPDRGRSGTGQLPSRKRPAPVMGGATCRRGLHPVLRTAHHRVDADATTCRRRPSCRPSRPGGGAQSRPSGGLDLLGRRWLPTVRLPGARGSRPRFTGSVLGRPPMAARAGLVNRLFLPSAKPLSTVLKFSP